MVQLQPAGPGGWTGPGINACVGAMYRRHLHVGGMYRQHLVSEELLVDDDEIRELCREIGENQLRRDANMFDEFKALFEKRVRAGDHPAHAYEGPVVWNTRLLVWMVGRQFRSLVVCAGLLMTLGDEFDGDDQVLLKEVVRSAVEAEQPFQALVARLEAAESGWVEPPP